LLDKIYGGQEDRLLNNITISQCILKSIYAIIITQGITNELHPLSGEAEFPQGANAPDLILVLTWEESGLKG